MTACLSRFFLKLLRQHSLSKRIEVECMCVFWVAVTASLNFFFYSCCCFFNGAATALKMCVCVCGGGGCCDSMPQLFF